MPAATNKPPILGIDLGTSTCLACVELAPGQFTYVQPDKRVTGELMPSYFCNTESGALIGEAARQQLTGNRRNDVVRCVKRYLRDPERKHNSGGEEFTSAEISSRYLRHLRIRAEDQFELPPNSIQQAIVTVPANFGIRERTLTKDAAQRAGLEPHLLDEPIAAAYGLGLHDLPGVTLAMVVDLGGGTLDVTLLLSGRSVDGHGIVELGRDGDEELGGDKWDEWLAKYALIRKSKKGYPPECFDFRNIGVYAPFEAAKRELCGGAAVRNVQYSDYYTSEPTYVDVTQDEFRHATFHLAERCVLVCDRLLKYIPADDRRIYDNYKRGLWAKCFPRRRPLDWQDVDKIYLVGGGGRMPMVREALQNRWGREIKEVLHPQHQVARGAAAIARQVENDNDFFREVHLRSPHSYGFFYYPRGASQPRSFHTLIHRNELLPPKKPEGNVPISRGAVLTVEIGEQRWRFQDTRENLAKLEHFIIGEVSVPDIRDAAAVAGSMAALRMDYAADRAMFVSIRVGDKEPVRVPIVFEGKKDVRVEVLTDPQDSR